MMLDLLVCHLQARRAFLDRLQQILAPQLTPDVRVLIDDSQDKSIGRKRNDLLGRADAEYLAFIDDDDRVSSDYVTRLMEGMRKGVDCCSLVGEITFDGVNPRVFLHSTRYKAYYEQDGVYYRYPNHLNCVKTSIARQFSFPDVNFGEDQAFATQMFNANVLKTEHEIAETIYFYDFRSRK
jgi:hypothetical protein